MTNEDIKADFLARAAALAAAEKQANEGPVDTPVPEEFAGDAPEIETTEADKAWADADSFIKSINIVDFYTKLTGKSIWKPSQALKPNGIEVFCPAQGHNNTNTPAAQLDRIKQVFLCHNDGCGVRGGVIDMFSCYHGGAAGKELKGEDFKAARAGVLEMFGYENMKLSNGKKVLVKTEPPAPKEEGDGRPLASVIPLQPTEEDENIATSIPQHFITPFDWRKVIPAGTFLHDYVSAGSHDDSVEEFHLFCALTLLGMVVGKQAFIEDQYTTYGNLYVVMYGHTGTGKTNSTRYMDFVRLNACDFDEYEEPQSGIKYIKNASTTQGIVTGLRRYIKDPSAPKAAPPEIRGDVKAIIEFNELSGLTSRLRKDNTGLLSTILDLYGAPSKVGSIAKADGSGGFYAENPLASLITGVQPNSTASNLNEDDISNGTINRFFFVAGKYKEPTPIGKPILHLFLEPIEKLKKIKAWADDYPGALQWSDEAAELWTQWHQEHYAPKRGTDDNDIFVRAAENMKRLVLLYACNSMHMQIEASDVECAIAMWPWMESCTKLMFGKLVETKKSELEARILHIIANHVEKKKENPSTGLVYRRLTNNGKTADREEMLKALSTLEMMGEIKRHEPVAGARGRPVERWSPTA